MVAVELRLKLRVVTVKLAELDVAATVTEAGTLRIELLSASVTLAPPVGAVWVKVTVQVLEELGPIVEGLQASEDTPSEAPRLSVVLTKLPP